MQSSHEEFPKQSCNFTGLQNVASIFYNKKKKKNLLVIKYS